MNQTTVPSSLSAETMNVTEATIRETDQQITSRSSFIIYSTINSFFCVVGIVGNILVVLVFAKRKEKKASTIYTIALAVIDLLTCAGSMSLVPVEIASLMSQVQKTMHRKFFIFMVYMSVFVLLAISVDRYQAVYKPVTYNINSKRKAFLSLVAIVPASLFFIVAYEMHIRDMAYFAITSITLAGCIVAMAVLYGKVFYRLFKHNRLVHGHSNPNYQVPVSSQTKPSMDLTKATTSTLNNEATFIDVKEYTESTNGSTSMQSSRKKPETERDGNRNMVRANYNKLLAPARIFAVVTVVFVVSYLPPLLVNQRVIQDNWYFEYAFYLNHIINPVIYGVLNKTFRQELKNMFRF